MPPATICDFAITRFEYRLDRSIGDSQVHFDTMHAVALELHDGAGHVGLGFGHKMFEPYPSQAAMTDLFAAMIWPGIAGSSAAALAHRVDRPRGGNRRDAQYGFEEALQVALWDLAAQQAGLPLARYLGGRRDRVRAYASGLDYHMDDATFAAFFARAASHGFDTFKIKIGHPDPDWDLHRLRLLRDTVGDHCGIMADANEAWTAKQAAMQLTRFRDAGIDLIWMEDPILRDDLDGLRALRQMCPWTQINSGEYLGLTEKRALLQAGGTDILNVHGKVSDTMRIGWLAGDMGVPVTLGNTFLETGLHTACALPEVAWLEYSFLSNDHLIDTPVAFEDGYALLSDRPGLGFALSDAARSTWSMPEPCAPGAAPVAPPCRFMAG